jgi:hypothetical protein
MGGGVGGGRVKAITRTASPVKKEQFVTRFFPPRKRFFEFQRYLERTIFTGNIHIYIIKVHAQPRLGNNDKNFGQNINHQTSYLLLYKYEVVKLGS